MPDTLVDLLIRFLSQNKGKLSKRGRAKEFEKLTEKEIKAIEAKYAEVFSLVEQMKKIQFVEKEMALKD